MKTIKSQAGHAALLFALFIPVLFGVFALATDGARAIQDKARLEEATEVAALAVAGQNSDVEKTQKETAQKYIKYYFPNAEVPDDGIKVVKLSCEKNPDCDNSGASQRFFQYSVNASIVETSWFPGNKAIVGIGENYDVAGYSVARKYQSKTVDVIFIADFSGSMSNTWNGKEKYTELIKIIKEVTDELDDYNDQLTSGSLRNTAAFTAYDEYAQKTYTYEECGGRRCRDVTTVCRVNHVYSSGNATTINHIFDQNKSCTSYNYNYLFYQINATSNFSDLNNTVKFFRPDRGYTASFQGLIDGANLAYYIDNPNPRQLLVVLSDGIDEPQRNMTRMESLVNDGMCTTILDKLQSRTSTNEEGIEENIKARIAMIGFGYDVKSNVGLTKCVGADNVFSANNRDAIKNKILELITEEIGHLAPSEKD